MKHLRTFESNDERSEMIDQLCEMGYDKATCDAMSYEELCDCMEKELSKKDEEDSYEDTYESQKSKIGALKDSVLNSNLKHLKSFELFDVVNEEEGKFREFFTGHASKEAKEKAKLKFMKALEDAEKELMEDPEDYAQSKNWEEVKQKLIKQAKEDNFKGGLRVQRGGRDPRIFIVYDKGVTGFQKLAIGASGEVNVRK
jgi:hypothetical protein